MPIAFKSNIASLHAQTELNKTNNALAKTFERLSSGLRINGASDDPAGLAVADILRSQARVAGVAIRNANGRMSSTERVDPPGNTADARSNNSADRGRATRYRSCAASNAPSKRDVIPPFLPGRASLSVASDQNRCSTQVISWRRFLTSNVASQWAA